MSYCYYSIKCIINTINKAINDGKRSDSLLVDLKLKSPVGGGKSMS